MNSRMEPQGRHCPQCEARSLEITLSQQQIKDSPDITAHPPVSRQMAAANSHIGVYLYGGLAGLWGLGICPGGPASLARVLDALAEQHGSEQKGQLWAAPQAVMTCRHQTERSATSRISSSTQVVAGEKGTCSASLGWRDRLVRFEDRRSRAAGGYSMRPLLCPRMLADPGYETWLHRAYERLHI